MQPILQYCKDRQNWIESFFIFCWIIDIIVSEAPLSTDSDLRPWIKSKCPENSHIFHCYLSYFKSCHSKEVTMEERWFISLYQQQHIGHTSMTSLLPHTVAQPTKWRFLPKNLSQLVIFVIGLAFTWVWGDKNHPNLVFKVNFLCQKSVLLFWYLFLLKLLD